MVRKQSGVDSSPSSINQISFNQIDLSFTLKDKTKIRQWILATIKKEKNSFISLSFNFCSDDYLLQINQQHLNHHYFTDIITFDLADKKGEIEGDIYISLDRVRDNAKTNQVSLSKELKRVIIHGVLHLCGYKDKTSQEVVLMRKKEDYYLSLLA